MLDTLLLKIHPLEQYAMEGARKRWNSIAKPLYSLGRLEEMIVQIAGITGDILPSLKKPCVVVMCADHGVVAQGVTQTGQEVTALVSRNMAQGKASVNRMAATVGAKVYPVDMGIATAAKIDGMIDKKTMLGTQDMTVQPAMTRFQAQEAILAGISMVEFCKEQGHTIIATGEMGIGNTTAASAMAAVLLRRQPWEVTGRGAGLSTQGLHCKIAAIEKAVSINSPDPKDPLDVLSKVGGLDIAGMTGLFLGGAIYRVPVVIDGFISSVAALCAVQLCPSVGEYILPSHLSGEPAGRMVLEALGKEPVIDGKLCLGEGTGAVMLFPMLAMAMSVYKDMETFTEIEMESYQPLS